MKNPITYHQIMSQTREILRADKGKIMAASLKVFAIMAVIGLLLRPFVLPDGPTPTGSETRRSILCLIPITLLFGLLYFGLCQQAIKTLRKEAVGDWEILAGFGRMWLKIVVVCFIASALSYLGLFLFIVPGIIFALMFLLTEFVIIDDNRLGVWKVLARSRSLSKGSRMAVFHVLVVYYGAMLIVSMLTESVPIAWELYSPYGWTSWFVGTIGGVISACFFTPPIVVASAVYYESCLKAETAESQSEG